MKVLHVEWLDSQTDIGWEPIEAIAPCHEVTHTVGLFLAETANSVVIAHSYDPATKEFNGRIYIPIVSIIEMRTICQIKT